MLFRYRESTEDWWIPLCIMFVVGFILPLIHYYLKNRNYWDG